LEGRSSGIGLKSDSGTEEFRSFGCTASRSDSVGGLGDIEFWAVALSWSALNNDLHVNFCGGIYAPTGAFHNNRLANQGLGYWTFEPGVMVSYLSQKNGFEFSTYIGYDINTENTATDYLSGQQFSSRIFGSPSTRASSRHSLETWHSSPAALCDFGS